MDFYELRIKAGLLNRDLADLFGVSRSTIKRWEKTSAPSWALERLSLMAGTHPSWKDYQIRDGFIVTPSGEEISKSQVANYHYLQSLLNNAITNLRTAQNELSQLKYLRTSTNDETTVNVFEKANSANTILYMKDYLK